MKRRNFLKSIGLVGLATVGVVKGVKAIQESEMKMLAPQTLIPYGEVNSNGQIYMKGCITNPEVWVPVYWNWDASRLVMQKKDSKYPYHKPIGKARIVDRKKDLTGIFVINNTSKQGRLAVKMLESGRYKMVTSGSSIKSKYKGDIQYIQDLKVESVFLTDEPAWKNL